MHLHVYVSGSVGLICLAAAVAFWWRGKHQTPRLCIALMLAAGLGLAASTLGGWLHSATTWLAHAAGDLLGQWLAAAPLVLLLILAGVITYEVYVHIRHHEITWKTLALASMLPVLDTAIPGTLGTVVMFVIDLIAWPIVTLVALLVGLG